ncbi:hypothetical protein [Microbacterium sp. bgisy203]|uniref:hypothetical protein n=1 Tax=Microbacterium sp. bgisy203 TaxID=3413799 RepID=UPI003D708BD4
MKGYHPPTYPLLEARFHRSENDTVRWLYGWNGPVTEAARDVTLAASAPAGRALVTSGIWVDERDVRLSALLVANSLEQARLFPSAGIDTAIDDMLWLPAPLTINGESTQVLMGQIGECTVAYAIDAPEQFAAAWAKGSELESLSTIDATGYLINPLEMHSYPSLNEQTTRVMSVVDFY